MSLFILRKTAYVLGLLNLALACRPEAEPDKPGVPTTVGKPLGAVISKPIGPAGGILSSADGTMTLRFPAGALATETV